MNIDSEGRPRLTGRDIPLAVVLAIGVVCLGWTAKTAQNLFDEFQIRQNGTVTTGEVLQSWSDANQCTECAPGTLSITYRYYVGSEPFTRLEQVGDRLYGSLTRGSSVMVRYSQSNPSSSRIEGNPYDRTQTFITLYVDAVLLAAAIIYLLFFRPRRYRPQFIRTPAASGGALSAQPKELNEQPDAEWHVVTEKTIAASELAGMVREANGTLVKAAPGEWLEISIRSNDPDEVGRLIDQGIDVNAGNAAGDPPIVYAVRQGRGEIVKLLIAAGADVNKRTRDGRTALHAAAEQGQTEIARILLAAGADGSLRDETGQTPLQAAERNGNQHTAAVLARAAR